MADKFSTIGFPFSSKYEFMRYGQDTFERGEPVAVDGGSYRCRRAGNGPELWLQLDAESRPLGLASHFDRGAVWRVVVTGQVLRSESNLLKGGLYASMDLGGDLVGDGTPFVVDAPDFRRYQALQFPMAAEMQLAAFALEVTAYPDEDAYYAAQETEYGKRTFAPNSFFPLGLFGRGGEASEPPDATALFAGRILETAPITNAITGVSFLWARVATLGGEVDVVADPLVVEGELVEGGTVQGQFWLSGRLPRKT